MPIFETLRTTLRSERMLGHGETQFFASGRGPCVVGLHGFSGTASELRPLLDRIAGAGYAVDGAVLPGHGTLPHELQNVTFDDWVADTRRRMRAAMKQSGSAVLLGFSLGSLVAMQVALEDAEAYPPSSLALVLLGCALTLRAPTSTVLAMLARLPRVPDVYMVKPVSGNAMDAAVLKDLVTYDRHPMRAATEVYRAGPRVRKGVDRIRCPTLVLHGRHDLVCPWQSSVWLGEHLGAPDVTVRIFERSAHLVARDFDRDAVASEVLGFLGRFSARHGPPQVPPVDP